MNIPDDLQLVDAQGNARKNGEERRAINAIHEYLRWLSMDETGRGYAEVDKALSERPVPSSDRARFTVQSAVHSAPMPGRIDDLEEAGPPPGTVWEKFGEDSPFVAVKAVHGWDMVRREQANLNAMVAGDEAASPTETLE